MAANMTVEAGGFKVEFVMPPVAKVELILQPNSAVDGLATIIRGYKQVYSAEPASDIEAEQLLQDVNRTKLHTPLEMLSFTWLVRDVTRAFTHQMVRTRVGAAYVQESMRFSDKRNARVLVPPAIAEDSTRLSGYQESVMDAFLMYARMVEQGVPIQDARGILPHNVLTHIFVSYTLSTLAKTAALRYCCQAQAMKADGEGEWKTVLEQMKASLPNGLVRFVCAPWEAGEVSCGFEASFDRPCRFTDKFRPNYEALRARMEPDDHPPKPAPTTYKIRKVYAPESGDMRVGIAPAGEVVMQLRDRVLCGEDGVRNSVHIYNWLLAELAASGASGPVVLRIAEDKPNVWYRTTLVDIEAKPDWSRRPDAGHLVPLRALTPWTAPADFEQRLVWEQ